MKKWYFRERNYRTLRESVIPTKKAPQKVLIINGAISKNRTENYDDFKLLSRKIEIFREKQKT